MIEVKGELDWRSVASLLEQVAAANGQPRLVIDLTAATRIDSAGTGALIAAFLRERRTSKKLAIITGEPIAAFLREVGLADVVPVLTAPADGNAWLAATA